MKYKNISFYGKMQKITAKSTYKFSNIRLTVKDYFLLIGNKDCTHINVFYIYIGLFAVNFLP